jgi:hypothetical protein
VIGIFDQRFCYQPKGNSANFELEKALPSGSKFVKRENFKAGKLLAGARVGHISVTLVISQRDCTLSIPYNNHQRIFCFNQNVFHPFGVELYPFILQ